jgi:hypothetical protein
MSNTQWAELLAALRALRPSAWAIWAPVLAGLAGAAFGFFASILKDQVAQAVHRKQSIADDVRDRRRVAIEALNADVSKWILQWSGLQANRGEHHAHNMTVATAFLKTGDARHGALNPVIFKFLNGLEESLNSYSMGWPVELWPNRWTNRTESLYLEFADDLRSRTERWFNGKESTASLVNFLDAQIPKHDALRESSLLERGSGEALR